MRTRIRSWLRLPNKAVSLSVIAIAHEGRPLKGGPHFYSMNDSMVLLLIGPVDWIQKPETNRIRLTKIETLFDPTIVHPPVPAP